MALSGLSGRIVVFLLGPAFESSYSVLLILLWAAGFRIAAIAGQTFVLSAGERSSFQPALHILLAVGLLFYGVVLSRYGINGGAFVTACISFILAFITIREGTRLVGIIFPWVTLLRVMLAVAVTQLFCIGFNFVHLPLFVVLTLAVLFYLAVLIVLREVQPTREHFIKGIHSISAFLSVGVKAST
jgi:O-antigen/teichoic acid export membrane protein